MSVAINEIDSDVSALVSDVGVESLGAVSVDAKRGGSIKSDTVAVAVAAGIAPGGGGRSAAGAGAVALNDIKGSIVADVSDSTIGTEDEKVASLSVKADDVALIDALVGAVSAQITVGSQTSAGFALGGSAADNKIGSEDEVRASLSGTTVEATGAVEVKALADATIKAEVLAGAVGVSGSASGAGAISGAGVGVSNDIDVATRALITGGDGVDAGSIVLSAKNDAKIDALAGSAAVAGSMAGGNSAAISIGLSIALNDISGEVKAAVSGAELEAGNGGIAITADNTAKINVKALTASVAAGFGGSNSIAVSGGGAGASNIVNVDVEASATDSTLDSAGLMKVAALGDSEITATIAAISVAATAGNKGFGVSIGAAAAVNRIGDWNVTGAIVRSQAVSGSSAENLAPDQAEDDDTSIPAPVATERVLPNGNATMTETSGVKAFLSDTTVEGGGDLSVTATSSGKIDATVAAASVALALGSTGAGISAGGVYVLNFIGVDTAAYVDNTDGNDIDADDIAITASDSTEIDVLAGAASLAGGFGASNGVAVSIGFAMADNTTKGAVEAYLKNADDVSATGAISVGATNSSNIDATAATASISAAIGGTNGISFSGGGAVARNDILTDTSAFIEGSAVTQADSISVSASSTSVIDADILAVSLSVGVGGTIGGAASFGAAVALNNIGNGAADRNKVEAYVRGSGITTAGLLSLQATSSQTIKARVAAGSAAIGGGTVGVGISAAGVGGHNTIAVRTAAFIDGASKTITAGSIDIDAIDTSDIDAFAGAASLAAGFGTTAVAVTIGVSIALNEIDNDVYAGISGDQTVATTNGGITIDATSDGKIEAKSYAASLGIGIGTGTGGVALSGAGATARNSIKSDTAAKVTGGSIDSFAGISVKAKQASDIDATIAALTLAIAADASGAVGAAIGVSIAENFIGNGTADRNLVEASLTGVKAEAEGALEIDALSDNSIDALVAAAAAALSAAGGAAVSLSGAGADAKNRIHVATKAFIDGDGTGDTGVAAGVHAGSVAIQAKDDSSIKSQAYAGAIAASFGAVGVSVAMGVGFADNTIANTIDASIKNTDDTVSTDNGGITVKAIDNATIDAISAAASLAVAVGGGVGVSISGGGASAKNLIDNDVTSLVQDSILDSGGLVTVSAESTSKITAKIAAIAVAAGLDPGVGIGVAIGASVAINQIGEWSVGSNPTNDPMHAPTLVVGGGSKVQALVSGGSVTAGGDVAVRATSSQTIKAEVIAAAAAVAVGTAGIGGAGAGAYAENRIAVATDASIVGTVDDLTLVDASNITVEASDTALIDALVGAAALAAAFGGTGVSVTVAVAVAKNTIANDTSAYAQYADLRAEIIPVHDPVYVKQLVNGQLQYVLTNDPGQAATPGTITIGATQGSTIKAKSGAAAVALAVGGFGAALAGGGAVALNIIGGSTKAYAEESKLLAGDDIGVSASNTSTITAQVAGLSAAVSIGGVSVGASIGAAVARNFIGYNAAGTRQGVDVFAYLSDTSVSTYGALNIGAVSNQTITAEVLAASVAVSAGFVATGMSAAGAYTENKVAADVHAYIDNTGLTGADDLVKAADISVSATDTTSITSYAGAASLAVSIGVISANAISLGAAVALNTIDNSVKAYIQQVGNLLVTGDIPVQSNGFIYRQLGQVQTGGGLFNALGVWVPPTYVTQRIMPAYSLGSGLLNVSANETATLISTAQMAAVAASLGGIAVAGGGAVTTNSVLSETKAHITSSTVGVNGDVTVEAHDQTTVTSLVDAIGLALGIGLAATGAAATSTIEVDVSARIDSSPLSARHVVVEATATPSATSETRAVNAGAAAVGVSVAKAIVDNSVEAFVGGAAMGVASLRVSALELVPTDGYTAYAKAQGMAGGLIGADATITEATSTSVVTAVIGAGTIINAVRSVSVGAQNDSRQRAESDSIAFGIAAVGATKAKATSGAVNVVGLPPKALTLAALEDDVEINAGSVTVAATGLDDNFAKATPGSVGALAIAAADIDTSAIADTQATIGGDVEIQLTKSASKLAGETDASFALYQQQAGTFALAADHFTRANTELVTSAYGLLAGAGASADNYIYSKVNVVVGDGAEIKAAAIQILAANRFEKVDIGKNVDGHAAALVAGAGASSDTELNLTTKVTIHDNAWLEVQGTSANAGAFTVRALNTVFFRETVAYKSGGLGSGVLVTSELDGDNITATVQLGTTPETGDSHVTLKSAGNIELAANTHADAEMNVSVDNYGGVTVSVAQAMVDLRPVNSVIVGRGSTVKAQLDVNMLAGMNAAFKHDEYRVRVFADTFAGSPIPLGDVKTDAFIYQQNLITIHGDATKKALVEAGGNVRLYADKDPFADITAQGKAVNWASAAAGALDSALGGSAHSQTTGTAHQDLHGIVTVDGLIKTGANRKIDIVIIGIEADGDGFKAVLDDGALGAAGVTLSVESQELQSSYFDELEAAREARDQYYNNADLVAFYNKEIARLTKLLLDMNLAEEVTADGVTELVPVRQVVATIVVAPIFASAGYIDVRADVLQGSGELSAPGDVRVSIVNETEHFLEIEGITIPQNNGGVFFNGFDKPVLTAADAITQSAARAAADNSDGNRAGEGLLVPGATTFTVTLSEPDPEAPADGKPSITIKNTLSVLAATPRPGRASRSRVTSPGFRPTLRSTIPPGSATSPSTARSTPRLL